MDVRGKLQFGPHFIDTRNVRHRQKHTIIGGRFPHQMPTIYHPCAHVEKNHCQIVAQLSTLNKRG